MHVLSLLTGSALLLFCIPTGYLLLTTLAAYCAKKPAPGNAPPLFMGVLIPAHDEEAGIAQTIRAVKACTYPENRVRIFVIADNCTDATARAARNAGARVMERSDTANRGKGQALNWFLQTHTEEYHDLDALTIIDADTLPDTAYLREMSSSLSQKDIDAVQAYNGVSNPGASWRTGLSDAAFNVFNHLRMAGLYRLAGTCMLKGNGMGFTVGLLKKYGWPAHSVVEDMEFSLLLFCDGVVVHYNPAAVIRSEMVSSGKNAAGQRTRWEGGRFSVIRALFPDLFSLWIKSPNLPTLYVMLDLIFPPLSLHVMTLLLLTLATGFFVPTGQALMGCHWAVLVFYVVSGQIQRQAQRSTWLYLLTAPAFIAWKIPLYLKMLAGKKKSAWTRTPREQRLQETSLNDNDPDTLFHD